MHKFNIITITIIIIVIIIIIMSLYSCMSLLLCCYKNKLKIKFLEHLIAFNKKKKRLLQQIMSWCSFPRILQCLWA